MEDWEIYLVIKCKILIHSWSERKIYHALIVHSHVILELEKIFVYIFFKVCAKCLVCRWGLVNSSVKTNIYVVVLVLYHFKLFIFCVYHGVDARFMFNKNFGTGSSQVYTLKEKFNRSDDRIRPLWWKKATGWVLMGTSFVQMYVIQK